MVTGELSCFAGFELQKSNGRKYKRARAALSILPLVIFWWTRAAEKNCNQTAARRVLALEWPDKWGGLPRRAAGRGCIVQRRRKKREEATGVECGLWRGPVSAAGGGRADERRRRLGAA